MERLALTNNQREIMHMVMCIYADDLARSRNEHKSAVQVTACL